MFLGTLTFLALTSRNTPARTLELPPIGLEDKRPISIDLCAPFDSSIPKPESILGYPLGSRITTYRDQERVVETMTAAAKGQFLKIQYGKSGLGLPLRVFIISSPKNIARWEQIRKLNEDVALGKAKPTAELPAIVWINECIHGNEPASFESSMALIYNLLAGKGTGKMNSAKAWLENTVVVVNPSYNPDGHERFAVYYNSIARGSAEGNAYEKGEPSVVHGRTNQFRFDMNRDRIAFSQDETKQEVALFNKIRPHVYVDQHGQVENYFMPPNPMAINANVDRDRVNNWTDIFGRSIAGDFDKTGWSYFVRTEYDLYYPGFLDSHTTLCGAIGMTHETDGGKYINKLRADGSEVSLREGLAKHLTSALAVIRASSEKHTELVASFAKFKESATSGSAAGKFQRVVIAGDPQRSLKRLKDQLSRAGISSSFTTEPYKQKAHDFWSPAFSEVEFPAGSLVVDMNQENALMAKSLLEPETQFEDAFIKEQLGKKKAAPEGETYPGPEGSEFYELTGWALPYAHNLKAWWCEDRPSIKTTDTMLEVMGKPDLSKDVPAYVLPYNDRNDILAAHDLLALNVRVMVTGRDMKVGGKDLKAGAFLIFRTRNEDDLLDKIREVSFARRVQFQPLTTSYPDAGTRFGPGNYNMSALARPSVGVFFGSGANMAQVSGIWFTLEREYKVPFIAVDSNNSGDLSQFTVLVAPAGAGVVNSSKVKDWIRAGGILVVLGDNSAVGSSSLVNLTATSESTRSLPGALFRASIDKRSLLSSGYASDTNGKCEISVPLDGSTFFKSRKEGGSIVKLSADEKATRLLTGWTWGEETEKAVKDAVFLQDEPLGQGHVIWFATDPTDRAMWPGLDRLLLNALVLMKGN